MNPGTPIQERSNPDGTRPAIPRPRQFAFALTLLVAWGGFLAYLAFCG